MNWLERLLPGLWAYRDVHPMVVHFPIALFPVATLFAWLELVRLRAGSASTARVLLLLGTLGAAVSIATGLAAQGTMPHGDGTPVSAHRTLMIVAGVLAVALLAVSYRRRRAPEGRRLRVLCGGLLLLNGLLLVGADRGALVARAKFSEEGAALPEVAAAPSRERDRTASAGDPGRGRQLFSRLECAACHRVDAAREAPGIPPTLAFAGSILRPEWTREYLRSPHPIRWADDEERPVIRMPDFRLAEDEAADLSAYLATRTDTILFPVAPIGRPPLSEEEAREGRDLVASYACRGCHVIGGSGGRLGPDLDAVGTRLRPAYIYAILKSPASVVPGTPMKDFHLWEKELRCLTSYLTTLRAD